MRVNGVAPEGKEKPVAVALAQQEAVQLRGSALTQEEFLSLARETGTPIGSTGYTDLNTGALLAKLSQLYTTPVAQTPVTAPVTSPATTAATAASTSSTPI